jgi:hypothetical protein
MFDGKLPADIAQSFGYVRRVTTPPVAPPKSESASDGAVRLLSLLQQEARLVDFLMEDISPYTDEQVGAAVRDLHENSQKVLNKHLKLAPVIDGVEGAYTNAPASESAVRFVGNVPPGSKPKGGTLRHKGWRVESVTLPKTAAKGEVTILAPAELEVE